MWSKNKDCGSQQTSLGRPQIPSMTLNLFHSYLPFRTFPPLPFDYGNPTVSIKASLAFLLCIGLTPTNLNCFQLPGSGQQHLQATYLPVFSFRSYYGKLKEEWIDRSIKGAQELLITMKLRVWDVLFFLIIQSHKQVGEILISSW